MPDYIVHPIKKVPSVRISEGSGSFLGRTSKKSTLYLQKGKSEDLGSRFPGSFGLGSHRSLQLEGESDVLAEGDDGDGDGDIYIMMQCLCVCVSRKIITSSWESPVST